MPQRRLSRSARRRHPARRRATRSSRPRTCRSSRPATSSATPCSSTRGTMSEAQIQSFLQSKVPTCQSGLHLPQGLVRHVAHDVGGCDVRCVLGRRARARVDDHLQGRPGLRHQPAGAARHAPEGAGARHAHLAERLAVHDRDGTGMPRHRRVRHALLRILQPGATARRGSSSATRNPPGTSQYFTWYAPGQDLERPLPPERRRAASSPVYIQNQATANLYYYTPYQPNAAALRAGYGEGDGCSAYGNRNFYQYFTDWFGSTQFAASGQIGDYWSRWAEERATRRAHRTSIVVIGQRWRDVSELSECRRDRSGGVTSHHFYDSLIYSHYVACGAHNTATLGWPRQQVGLQLFAPVSASPSFERHSRVDGVDGRPFTDGRQIAAYRGGRWPDVGVGYPRRSGPMGGLPHAETGCPRPVRWHDLHRRRRTDRDPHRGKPHTGFVSGNRRSAGRSRLAHDERVVRLGVSRPVPERNDRLDGHGRRVPDRRRGVRGLRRIGRSHWSVRCAAGSADTSVRCGLRPARHKRSRGGTAYLPDGLPATMLLTSDPIAVRYGELGGPTGRLGWPTKSSVCQADRCRVEFQNGVLDYSSAGGTQEVAGPSVPFVRTSPALGPRSALRSGALSRSASERRRLEAAVLRWDRDAHDEWTVRVPDESESHSGHLGVRGRGGGDHSGGRSRRRFACRARATRPSAADSSAGPPATGVQFGHRRAASPTTSRPGDRRSSEFRPVGVRPFREGSRQASPERSPTRSVT